MEFRARRSRNEKKGVEVGELIANYDRPPGGVETLRRFEEAAGERVRALRTVGAVAALKGVRPHTDDWRRCAADELRKEGLRDYARLTPDPQFLRRDALSHFALRLVYCGGDEARKWLVARELELFALRASALKGDALLSMARAERVRCDPLQPNDRRRLEARLIECSGRRAVDSAHQFYIVDFADALDAVRTRKCYLERGNAYVPEDELSSILATRFRARLNEGLAAAARRLPALERDERLAPLLTALRDAHLSKEYKPSETAKLPLETIDAAADNSFAPCMKHAHSVLKTKHHLKHGARLQYGLFLKAAGLDLEDALTFWRNEFTKVMDSDRFEKTYAYNVRYNYGKEGARKNYSPYGCGKIIQANVGPDDAHGCPFRHFDSTALRARLVADRLSSPDIAIIEDFAKKGLYQVACSRYFDASHGVKIELGINHPNQYFDESRKLISSGLKNSGISSGNSVSQSEVPPEEDISDLASYQLDDDFLENVNNAVEKENS